MRRRPARARDDRPESGLALKTIADNVPGLIAYADSNIRVRFVNGRCKELLGVPKEKIIGRHLREVIGAAAYEAGRASRRKALGGEKVSFETTLDGPHGVWQADVTLLPDMGGRKGRARGFYAMIQDVTGRREEERLRLIVESAPTGILVSDQRGRIVLVNSRLEAIFGHKRKALLGQPVELLVPKNLRARHRILQRAYSTAPKPRPVEGRELVGLRKDGRLVPIELGLNPFRSGGRALIMATVMDITDRLKARQIQSQRDREGVQKELLADLSHELKTPIATLRMAAETLLHRGLGTSQNSSQFLRTIGTQTERLSKLVDNLIRLAGQDGRSRPASRERFSLSGLVDGCVRQLSFLAKENHLLLRTALEPGINIRANRDDLRQAIENLIDNAIQYNRPEGKIGVSLRREAGIAHLRVQDTGIGISKSELPKLFRRFRRTHRARRLKPSGTGLGLALVKQVAEAHGGRVWATSRPGRGTAFHLSLPLR